MSNVEKKEHRAEYWHSVLVPNIQAVSKAQNSQETLKIGAICDFPARSSSQLMVNSTNSTKVYPTLSTGRLTYWPSSGTAGWSGGSTATSVQHFSLPYQQTLLFTPTAANTETVATHSYSNMSPMGLRLPSEILYWFLLSIVLRMVLQA